MHHVKGLRVYVVEKCESNPGSYRQAGTAASNEQTQSTSCCHVHGGCGDKLQNMMELFVRQSP